MILTLTSCSSSSSVHATCFFPPLLLDDEPFDPFPDLPPPRPPPVRVLRGLRGIYQEILAPMSTESSLPPADVCVCHSLAAEAFAHPSPNRSNNTPLARRSNLTGSPILQSASTLNPKP